MNCVSGPSELLIDKEFDFFVSLYNNLICHVDWCMQIYCFKSNGDKSSRASKISQGFLVYMRGGSNKISRGCATS